jgi:uncharacterized protein
MKSNRQFVIPFKGLKIGEHDFFFDVDDKFFADFQESEISKGNVKVVIHLDKKVNMLRLEFIIDGVVSIMCDRCLDDFDLPIAFKTNLFIKFGDVTEEQTDEILVLSHNEFELDVSQYIYEYTHLSLPYRRIHPDDENGLSTCNKEMLKRLDDYLFDEKNENTDPRWDDLKNLTNNN